MLHENYIINYIKCQIFVRTDEMNTAFDILYGEKQITILITGGFRSDRYPKIRENAAILNFFL